ncbi:ParA family protein [Patescibacteria group bacterium]|nr:ParA family protein [Patescibacteria group bacterium]
MEEMEIEERSKKRKKGDNLIPDQEIAENNLMDQIFSAEENDSLSVSLKEEEAKRLDGGEKRREEREKEEEIYQKSLTGPINQDTKKRVVAFYTHKGGVGKTSCLLSMAVKAAESKRVLVIDCDPQMNASHFLSRWHGPHFQFDKFYNQMVEHHRLRKKPLHELSVQERKWLDDHPELKGRNIYDILKDGFQPGRTDDECLSEFSRLGYNISRVGNNKGISLIASHPMLIEFEENIGDEDRRGSRAPDYSTRLRRFCEYMLHKRAYDVVFLDLSPSSSFLNQIAIVLSDLLIMPCSADEFAQYSIRTLGMWLETWHTRHRTLLEFRRHEGVKLLTVVYNRYKVYGKG